jgi:hypothetical protein
MKQIARNLTDCVDGFLKHTKYLILDRDPLYTRVFRGMLRRRERLGGILNYYYQEAA